MSARGTRRIATAVVLLALGVLGLAGCTTGRDVMATWDLRSTNDVAAVGWQGDLTAFEATSDDGLERILLPGGVEITGDLRANPDRDPDGQHLRSLVVTFEREPVAAVLARAQSYADPLDIDLAPVREWAQRNADGHDTSPGGAQALTGSVPLDPDDPDSPTLALSTRAFPDGDALLRVEVLWPRT